jgi:hypothetical protein
MSSKCTVLLLWIALACIPVQGHAQPFLFELIDCHVLDPAHKIETFGGISSLEHRGDGRLLLLSDHYRDGQSYLFVLDDTLGIEAAAQPVALQDAEAFRINEYTGISAFSFEGTASTGLITITYQAGKSPQYDTLAVQGIPGKNTVSNRYTSYNRGIEGLACNNENDLWMAFESGGDTSCGNTSLAFRQYRYKRKTNKYSARNFIEYTYPIDRCNCTHTKDGKKFDGSLGNGVSEILFLPGVSDQLLVLERCFDGHTGTLALWLATVHPKSRTLTKQLVFDFNATGSDQFKAFKPDNLEGMCWGIPEQGLPILYLVSDDNYRRGQQQTQLLKLRMKPRSN